MKKTILATTALVALIGAPALAADLAVRAPAYKAPPLVPVFNWSGCYVGGNGGGLWQHTDFDDGFGSHDASSWVAGVQVGCNYQAPGTGWVFGVQADYDWTDAKGSHVEPIFGIATFTSRAKSLGSVTGRVGYAWDRFLGYVKGGGAWERNDFAAFFTALPAAAETGNETRGGWTVGVGGEYAFTDWLSGFVEYDHYDFGTRTVTLVGPGFADTGDIKLRTDVVKAGLNIRFGGWGGPVVAKY